jgi:hypothetical protein
MCQRACPVAGLPEKLSSLHGRMARHLRCTLHVETHYTARFTLLDESLTCKLLRLRYPFRVQWLTLQHPETHVTASARFCAI